MNRTAKYFEMLLIYMVNEKNDMKLISITEIVCKRIRLTDNQIILDWYHTITHDIEHFANIITNYHTALIINRCGVQLETSALI